MAPLAADVLLHHSELPPWEVGRPPKLHPDAFGVAPPGSFGPPSSGSELGTSSSSSSSSSPFRSASSSSSKPSSFVEAWDGPTRPGPRRPTSFVIGCKVRNPPTFWSKYPCRSDEEESCNDVHATCRNVPAFGAVPDPLLLKGAFKLRESCKPRDMTVEDAAEGTKEATQEKAKEAAKNAGRLSAPTSAGFDLCTARMTDMPYMLNNPEAVAPQPKQYFKAKKWKAMKKVVTNSHLSESVWGHAVHGLSGTWSFDSFGDHAADYVYQVPQRQGAPSDYYICDSRTRPQRCALLGGNLEHACAEWYDPRQCNFCEDKGETLECQVRGWNNTWMKWARVPLYPRDILGELYRGEFRDTYARPKWATVTLKKQDLKDVKLLPPYMVSKGPATEAWEVVRVETSPPVKLLGLEGEATGMFFASVAAAGADADADAAASAIAKPPPEPRGGRRGAGPSRVSMASFL